MARTAGMIPRTRDRSLVRLSLAEREEHLRRLHSYDEPLPVHVSARRREPVADPESART